MLGDFTRKATTAVAIVAAAAALSAIVITANDVLLVLFGAVLAAVFLTGLSGLAERYAKIPRKAALPVVLILLLLLAAGAVLLFANRLSSEAHQLTQQLPAAQESLVQVLQSREWTRDLLDRLPDLHSVFGEQRGVLGHATRILSGGINVLINIFVICVIGIFLAAQPSLYIAGLLKLTPVSWRPRGRETAMAIGEALQSWLLGQLVCMAAVALLTGIGLSFLDIRLAFVLAVIAGLLDFIPTIGPLIAAVPAVLLALLQGPKQAVLVALLYFAVQAIENYILQPYVQSRAVNLPPALTLASQLLFAMLLGFGGIVLATPLTVTTLVLVRMLYVEDVLGDRSTDSG